MKPLDSETNRIALENECAALLMDAVPMVMRFIRAGMRGRRPELLSIAQFRTLAFVNRNQGTSLSEVAEHVGLTLPSMSKTVDALVARKLMTRMDSPVDRRRICLALTKHGASILESARQGTQASLAEVLGKLPPERRETIARAALALRLIFQLEHEAQTETTRSRSTDSENVG